MNSRIVQCVLGVCLVAVAGLLVYLLRTEPAPPDKGAPAEQQPDAAQSPAPPDAAPSAPAPVAAAVPAALAIAGRVTDEAGQPVADAVVDLHGTEPARTLRTDQSGNFSFSEVPKGTYAVSAVKAGYVAMRQDAVAAGTSDVALVLKRGAMAQGVVLAVPGEKPLEAFEVAAVAAGAEDDERGIRDRVSASAWTLVRHAEGKFEVPAPEGAKTLVAAKAEGYAPASVEVTDLSQPVVLRLMAGGTVHGEVVDDAGVPVPGASIFIGNRDKGNPDAQSDGNGRFVLSSLGADDRELTATHPQYDAGSVEIETRPGATSQVQLVLRQGGVIEGMVQVNGAPAEGWLVALLGGAELRLMASRSAKEHEKIAAKFPASIVTDSSGHFRFERVFASKAVTVGVRRSTGDDEEKMNWITQSAVVESGKTTTVTFNIPSALSVVEGLVSLEETPVTSAYVRLMVEGEAGLFERTTDTTRDGYFQFTGVLPGHGVLEAHFTSQGGERRKRLEFDVPAGQKINQLVIFQDVVVVEGSVAGMKPGETATAFILNGELPEVTVTSPQDVLALEQNLAAMAPVADGKFKFDSLDPGTYTLAVVVLSAERGAAGGGTVSRVATRVLHLQVGEHVKAEL